MPPTALIADDEPLLAQHLCNRLTEIWPELRIGAVAGNGDEALACIGRERPDIAFLDIKMPGLSGLEVAEQLGTDTHVVFVTAYDRYAVAAFEREAVDYLLKPVSAERLAQTVARLKQRIEAHAAAPSLRELLSRLDTLPPTQPEPLRWIRASVGETVRLVPVEDVLYFQAEDKYTVVVTRDGDHLIRLSIRELAAQLDPERFWQIHRGSIVNVQEIASATRDFRGRLALRLKNSEKVLAVSRSYAHLFRQM